PIVLFLCTHNAPPCRLSVPPRRSPDLPERAGGKPLDVSPRDDGVDRHDHVVNVALLCPVLYVGACARRVCVCRAMSSGAHLLVSDRKSTRLNSSHVKISYAVFCLKKKR